MKKIRKPARKQSRRRLLQKRRLIKLPPGVTYQSATRDLRSALRLGEEGAYDSGVAWIAVKQVLEGSKLKPRQYLTKEVESQGLEPPSPAELNRRAWVARTFDKPVVVRFGSVRKLAAGLQYFKNAGKTDFSTEDPGREPIQVPVAGGVMVTKLLADCTKEDLELANAAFRKPANSGLTTAEQVEEKLGQTALAKFVGDGGKSHFKLERTKDDLFYDLGAKFSKSRLPQFLEALELLVGKHETE